MTGIAVSRTFCAHDSTTLGIQALTIIKRLGAETIVLQGGDPALPCRESAVFLVSPTEDCRSSFVRRHSAESRFAADIERQRFLEEHMPWALAGKVLFINPRFAKQNGLFCGKPLRGFTASLAGLVGYVNPVSLARREQKKTRWQTGAHRRDRHSYFS